MNKHVTPNKVSTNDSNHGTFRAIRPQNKTYALGLSVEMTSREPAFASIPFVEWTQVLMGQIERNHCFFVIDEEDLVVGFAGWAYSSHDKAVAWLEQGALLDSSECDHGDCVILNAWTADSAAIQNFMIEHGKVELKGKKLLFAKRVYPDGKTRAVKLPINELHLAVGGHAGGKGA